MAFGQTSWKRYHADMAHGCTQHLLYNMHTATPSYNMTLQQEPYSSSHTSHTMLFVFKVHHSNPSVYELNMSLKKYKGGGGPTTTPKGEIKYPIVSRFIRRLWWSSG